MAQHRDSLHVSFILMITRQPANHLIQVNLHCGTRLSLPPSRSHTCEAGWLFNPKPAFVWLPRLEYSVNTTAVLMFHVFAHLSLICHPSVFCWLLCFWMPLRDMDLCSPTWGCIFQNLLLSSNPFGYQVSGWQLAQVVEYSSPLFSLSLWVRRKSEITVQWKCYWKIWLNITWIDIKSLLVTAHLWL